jgi:hypothetical protein
MRLERGIDGDLNNRLAGKAGKLKRSNVSASQAVSRNKRKFYSKFNKRCDYVLLCLHRDRKIKGHILHIGQLKVINVRVGVLICLDHVLIETIDLNIVKKFVSIVRKILTFSKQLSRQSRLSKSLD